MSPAHTAPPDELDPARVDFVAERIVSALADIGLFETMEQARDAAEAAIRADAEWRARGRS
jgi:hypothetical protein